MVTAFPPAARTSHRPVAAAGQPPRNRPTTCAARDWRPVRASPLVRPAHGVQPGVHRRASAAARAPSGRRAVVHPRQPGELAVRSPGPGRPGSARPGWWWTHRRRRSRPPSRARWPGPARRRRTSPAGRPSGPPQACVTSTSPRAGNRSLSVRRSASNTAGDPVELGPHRRAEVVRRAAAAEGQPPVRGALAVDDQVPVVAERRPAGQPDLRPTPPPAAARSRSSASTPARSPGAGRAGRGV